MDTRSLVDLKLNGVNASSQRARLAFFIAVLSACSIGVALYNEHFAWCRRLLDDGRGFTQWPPPSTASATPASVVPVTPPTTAATAPSRDSAGELSKEKRVQIIKNWEDNTNIKFDLLGIRLGSGDLTFFGSIAMLVVSIYLCLCARRSNLEVRSLVEEVTQSSENDKKYVLAGIRQSLVLTLVAEKHQALSDVDKTSSPRLLKLIGSVLSLLTYFPAVAIVGIILGDVEFAFFREDVPSRLWVLKNLNVEYLIQFIVLDLVALAVLIFVWYLNRLTNRFHDATGAAVESLATEKLAAEAGAGH